MSRQVQCDRYNSYAPRKSSRFIISTAYEGIPQNLCINVIAFTILISLFIFLRKKAWNYGNLAWHNKPLNIEYLNARSSNSHQEVNDAGSDHTLLRDGDKPTLKNRLLKYVPICIKMSDEKLKQRCGADAVTYCVFQRNLILVVAVMIALSLCVILPLNLEGGLLSSNSSVFSTLTIANVPKESTFLWGHFTVSLGLMIFAFFISTRFLNKIDIRSREEPSFTIMIDNVPVEFCDEMVIAQHFREAYPSVNPIKVQVTYEVAKMQTLYKEKVAAEEALAFCYEELENKNKRVEVIPLCCGRVCLASKCCQGLDCRPIDGIEFYTQEVKRLTKLFLEEKSFALNCKKLPIFFVTFENLEQALRIRRDYMYQNYFCMKQRPQGRSCMSEELRTDSWNVSFAPKPNDILWQNLHKRGLFWWLPIILINMLVGLLIIILSTPAMALNILKNMKFSENLEKLNNPLVAQFAPSLVMVLVSAMMPLIVYWSDQLSAHWTKTTHNLAIMNKLFTVLVITVLILPSLGLTSVPELVKWIFIYNNGTVPKTIKWECIFMADGGALFCNYIITASFIGIALEFLRLGELFMYTVKRNFSRSRAEDNAIIKSVLWEFQFGVGYAWTLALFTVISAYSVIVPIITPFGLTYLLMKHLVDRYNMIHVNVPSVVHNSVHCNAAQLMQVGLVLTQATVTVFVTLRRGTADTLAICCFLAFILGLVLTFGRTLKRWIFSMSWVKYSRISKLKDVTDVALSPSLDVGTFDDEGFIVVDEIKDVVFVPPLMSKSEDTAISEIHKSSTATSSEDNDTKPLNKPKRKRAPLHAPRHVRTPHSKDAP